MVTHFMALPFWPAWPAASFCCNAATWGATAAARRSAAPGTGRWRAALAPAGAAGTKPRAAGRRAWAARRTLSGRWDTESRARSRVRHIQSLAAMRAGKLKISHNVYLLTAGSRFRHYQMERRPRRMWTNYRPPCRWRVKSSHAFTSGPCLTCYGASGGHTGRWRGISDLKSPRLDQ